MLLDPFDDHLHAQIVADVADGAYQSPVAVRLQQPVSEAVIDLDEVHRVVEQRVERAEAGAEVIDGDADPLGSKLMQQG